MNPLRKSSSHLKLLLLVAFILTAFVYSFGISGPFIYDDPGQILLRKGIHDLLDLRHVIFNGLRQIRVWQNITFALNWAISPNQAWSFKVFNLLLHLLNGVLLFQWLKRCFSDKPHLATWGTAIFLLHPIQVESVSYVMGRTGLLQGFFYLLALGWYSKHGLRRMGGLVCILIASLFAKETCVLIPLLLLVYELTVQGGNLRELDWRRWGIVLAIPLLYLPIYMILKDPLSMYQGTTGFSLYPFYQYCAAQLYFQAFYLILFFYPPYQSIIHAFPFFTPLQVALAFWGCLGFTAGLMFAIRNFRKNPRAAFFILLFFIAYLPTNSVFQMVNPFAEYRLYLSNISLCLGFAWLLCLAFHGWGSLQVRLLLPTGVMIVFAFFTYKNEKIWTDAILIYEQGIKNYPTEQVILINLAHEYMIQMRADDAHAVFKKVRLTNETLPGYLAQKELMLAMLYFNQGHYDKSLAVIQELESDPAKDEPLPLAVNELKQMVLQRLKLKGGV